MGIFNAILGTNSKVSPEELKAKFGHMVVAGEQLQQAYRSVRDFFLFTDKRLILVDIQGLSGKKVEYLCIPYRSISYYSVETSGTFEVDSELKIWVRGMNEPIIKEFRKDSDIQAIYQLLSQQLI